ncbi:PqqA peptide cyclase [subsurface metagenome]
MENRIPRKLKVGSPQFNMPGGKITEITVELTTKCPLYCLHCSTNASPSESQVLPYPHVLKIIKESMELDAKKIALSGGEPFVYPSIPDLLSTASKIDARLHIYTSGNVMSNGTGIQPITDDLIGSVAETGHKLVFNIEGADERTHDYITATKGSFQNLIVSVQKASEYGVPFEFHFVPMKPNFEQLGEIVSMAEKMGAEGVSVLRFVPQGRGESNREKLDLTPSQTSQLFKDFARLKSEFPGFIRLGSPWNALGLEEPTPCASGFGKVLINPWGEAHVCEAFKHLTKGYNIIDGSLLEFLHETRELKFLGFLKNKCDSCTNPQWRIKGCIAQTIIRRQTSDTLMDPIYDALKIKL